MGKTGENRGTGSVFYEKQGTCFAKQRETEGHVETGNRGRKQKTGDRFDVSIIEIETTNLSPCFKLVKIC